VKIADCTLQQAPEILAIFNHEIAHTTAIYDSKPRNLDWMEAWFEAKRKGNYPIIGAFTESGSLAGFATFGPFRSWPGYKYSVEHSVYVDKEYRGKGLGKGLLQTLLQKARQQDYHMIIGGIDSSNTPSIRLHCSVGFVHCASIKQAGFKFGHWLDLEFYQLILDTPSDPKEA